MNTMPPSLSRLKSRWSSVLSSQSIQSDWGEPPFMTHGTVGTAEIATGETELGDFDRALGPDLPRAVALDLEDLEIVEDVAVEIECGGGDAGLERQEGSESPGHVIDSNDLSARLIP
jgi:hypothetical protein